MINRMRCRVNVNNPVIPENPIIPVYIALTEIILKIVKIL